MTIFSFLLMLLFGVVTLLIFIQSSVDLWEEVGSEVFADLKSTVNGWYRKSRLYMWMNNRKNKVYILSDRQYNMLKHQGKIKNNIIIDRRTEI